MNHAPNNPLDQRINVGKGDRIGVRSKEKSIGIDDIGLASDVQPEGARPLSDIRPESTRIHGAGDAAEMQGGNAMNPDQQTTDPAEPIEEKEKTKLEKVITKIVPPSHEVKDEDILDPGRMTPGSPPVDNQS